MELSLAPTTGAAGRARAAVGDWLAQGTVGTSTDEDVRLLVTELVSNSVRHAHIEAGQPLRVRASLLRETTLHIEVWDAGTMGAVAPGPPRLDDDATTGGFGLNLVARLSSEWGVARDALGTTVWFEMPA